MSCTRVLFPAFALAALVLATPRARAADCSTTAECAKGFTCQIVATTTPTPAPCPADTVCAQDAKAEAGQQATYGVCVEASCTTNADCGSGMVCHTEEQESCSGGSACPPNAQCFAPPATCTTTKVSTCMFKWQLPCSADAECGDGFTCQPTVSGACSGGSGTVTAGTGTSSSSGGGADAKMPSVGGTDGTAGGAGTAPPDMCTTTTSFPGYCAPKASTCTVDSDCPASWTCVDAYPTRETTANAGAPASSSSAAAAGSSGASIAPGEPAPTGGATPTSPPTKICQSPYNVYAVAKDAEGRPVETIGGGSTSNGGAAGSNGSTGGGTTQQPMTAGQSAATAGSGGCSLAGGAGGSALASALALLGLVAARRRRR